jgi:hypothetical protein
MEKITPSSAFEFKPAQQQIGAIAKFQAREAEETRALRMEAS